MSVKTLGGSGIKEDSPGRILGQTYKHNPLFFRVSSSSSAWSEQYVDQTDPELTEISLLSLPSTEIKGTRHTTRQISILKKVN